MDLLASSWPSGQTSGLVSHLCPLPSLYEGYLPEINFIKEEARQFSELSFLNFNNGQGTWLLIYFLMGF